MLRRSDKAFKGTVDNRALSSLHVESFEITLTVPLNVLLYKLDMALAYARGSN